MRGSFTRELLKPVKFQITMLRFLKAYFCISDVNAVAFLLCRGNKKAHCLVPASLESYKEQINIRLVCALLFLITYIFSYEIDPCLLIYHGVKNHPQIYGLKQLF